MWVYRAISLVAYKMKIIALKLRYGPNVTIKWSARIDPSVTFRINGSGHIHIGDCVELRKGCILNVSAGGQLTLSDRVFVNDASYFNARATVHVGEDTIIGQGVKIYDHDHDYRSPDFKNSFICSAVRIGQRVWICSNVIVLRGCDIGSDSVIAAGTVVKGDVDASMLCYSESHMLQRPIDRGKCL